MSRTVFVDTSAWLALVNKSDTFHEKAKSIRSSLLKDKRLFVVSDFVIAEIADSLSRIQWRAAAVKLVESIYASGAIQVAKVDQEIFSAAWSLYAKMKDKEWGFTDCTSFIVMKRYKVADVFSTDHHFEQAGFTLVG